jgi:4-hydroxy-2-oxoheptanedioate aldolase
VHERHVRSRNPTKGIEEVQLPVFDDRMPRLLRGTEVVRGVFVGIPSPALVEMCGFAGFDFVVIDNEHGAASLETTEHMVRAAKAADIAPIVRCTEPDILRVMDLGAAGIQVPAVGSAAQAQRIVELARYTPAGHRGAAFSTRAAGYGFYGGAAHVTASNEGTAVVVMIETPEALRNLDAIVAVPGVDAAFIGPSDLSFNLGHPADPGHADVQAAIADALARIARSPVVPGIMAITPDEYRRYRQWGGRYMTTVITAVVGPALRAARAAME